MSTWPRTFSWMPSRRIVRSLSNDSDLKEPINVARRRLGVPVGVLNPHPPRFRSRDLRCTFFKQIRAGVLQASQFPPVLRDAHGEIRKPAGW